MYNMRLRLLPIRVKSIENVQDVIDQLDALTYTATGRAMKLDPKAMALNLLSGSSGSPTVDKAAALLSKFLSIEQIALFKSGRGVRLTNKQVSFLRIAERIVKTPEAPNDDIITNVFNKDAGAIYMKRVSETFSIYVLIASCLPDNFLTRWLATSMLFDEENALGTDIPPDGFEKHVLKESFAYRQRGIRSAYPFTLSDGPFVTLKALALDDAISTKGGYEYEPDGVIYPSELYDLPLFDHDPERLVSIYGTMLINFRGKLATKRMVFTPEGLSKLVHSECALEDPDLIYLNESSSDGEIMLSLSHLIIDPLKYSIYVSPSKMTLLSAGEPCNGSCLMAPSGWDIKTEQNAYAVEVAI